MSTSWYLMDSPPIYNGGFEGQEFHAYATDGFQEVLDTTMLCDSVELINSDFSIIKKAQAIIQSVTPDSDLGADSRQILVPIGTLFPYSYIRFNGDIWLIVSEPSNNKFYEKAVLKICNNCLRWQDEVSKKIHSYWFWSEDTTRYSNGIHDGKIITKYDKQYSLMLPLDRATRRLHDGMRFMLEKSNNMPLVYVLTKFDGITGNYQHTKILKVSLTQTVYDKNTDNVDLMIADYNFDSSNNFAHNYTCKILYEKDRIKTSSFEKYYAEFTDNNGNVINDINYHWVVSSDEFNTTDTISLIVSDNLAKVRVGNDSSIDGKHFTLSVLDDEENTLASIVVTIESLW